METVCGIDEAGRGPLAGPVTAGAVVLPDSFPLELLADSKKLSSRKRGIALLEIMEKAFFGVGWVWPEEIDRINIHQASLLAMNRAWFDLPREIRRKVRRVQVDGKFPPNLDPELELSETAKTELAVEAVIKGDATLPHIQAASILAKEARDRWMIRYSWIEPAWQFHRHKGYPTELHRTLCAQAGLSEIHRRSFRIFSE